MANRFVDFLANCKTRKTNEMNGAKTMANQKNIGKVFSPEQARSKIVGRFSKIYLLSRYESRPSGRTSW